MNKKYFQTKSKTYAYAIQYVTGLNFYKFEDNDGIVVYSFELDEDFYNKVKKLNSIRFNQ